jgi:hypothetical protein
MCKETENLELIAERYKRQYKNDFGIDPKVIFISGSRLKRYEKEHKIKKLEMISGMQVFSHTYPGKKYRFI